MYYFILMMYEQKKWSMIYGQEEKQAIIQRFIYNFLLWIYSKTLAPDPIIDQGTELLSIF